MRTPTTTTDERDRDAFPGLEISNDRSDRRNYSGKFMTRNVRKLDVGVVPHPAVPVAAADAARLNVDDDAVGGWSRVGYVFDRQWPFEFLVDCCTHESKDNPVNPELATEHPDASRMRRRQRRVLSRMQSSWTRALFVLFRVVSVFSG